MGVSPRELSSRTFFDVLTSFLVDDLCHGLETRQSVRKKMREVLAGKAPDSDSEEAPKTAAPTPAVPDRATWGLLPEHQAGLQRAVGVMGVKPT